jgi:hypothetical protein
LSDVSAEVSFTSGSGEVPSAPGAVASGYVIDAVIASPENEPGSTSFFGK